MLLLSQRTEEKVDREPNASSQCGFQQLQGAAHKRHIAIRWDDVSAIRLDYHSVLHLENLHPGIALDQLGKDAFMVSGQVLDQTKAMPGSLSAGMVEKKASNAASPPAEAPMPTMGNSGLGRSVGDSTSSGLTVSSGAFPVRVVSAITPFRNIGYANLCQKVRAIVDPNESSSDVEPISKLK